GQRCCDGSSLVSIQERMVSTDAVQISRSHRDDRLVEKRSVEGGLDASHCGLEKSEVAEAGRATKQTNLFRVEAQHFIEREEERRAHHSLSRWKRPAYL